MTRSMTQNIPHDHIHDRVVPRVLLDACVRAPCVAHLDVACLSRWVIAACVAITHIGCLLLITYYRICKFNIGLANVLSECGGGISAYLARARAY